MVPPAYPVFVPPSIHIPTIGYLADTHKLKSYRRGKDLILVSQQPGQQAGIPHILFLLGAICLDLLGSGGQRQ